MARRYDYVPDNVYGSSEDFSDGFQISGGESSLEDNDPAAAFLRAAGGLTVQEERSFHDGENLDGATAADYQLHRITSMGYGIQASFKAALEQNLDGSKVGLTGLDIDVAVEDFTKITGVSAESFASRINIPEGQLPSSYPKDIYTAISMLSTAGDKMKAGPGYTLPGNVQTKIKQTEQNDELARAFADISAVSEYYMTDVTKGSDVYGTRKTAIEQSLYKRLLDMPFHESSRSIVPVPHEVGVIGVVPTKGSLGGYTDRRGHYQGGGSPYTRLEFANIEGELDPESAEYRALNPSAMHSLMPIKYPKAGTDAERASAYAELKEARRTRYDSDVYGRLQSARKTLKKFFPTMSDESQGQGRMAAWQKNMEDWDVSSNLYNEASITGSLTGADTIETMGYSTEYNDELSLFAHEEQGIEMPESNISRKGTGAARIYLEMGQTLKGSSTGTVHGDPGLSERDLHLEQQREYIANREDISEYGMDSDSDRARYLASLAGKPVAKQGSAEWLAQRKGLITGSVSTELGYEMGVETLASNLAAERLGYGGKWRGNAYTARGTKYEKTARESFLAKEGKGLNYEEAFFETDPSKPGFGVSPDGRLYHDDGSSAGLLELKILGDTTIGKAVKDYNRQMQMQMAITGESQTHFYALNADTGEYLYELIHADPELQEELLSKGKESLDLAANLDKRGVSEMDKAIKRAGRKKIGSKKSAGQEAKYTPGSDEAETPMEAFNAITTVGGTKIRVETGLEDEIEGLEDFMKGFGGGGSGGGGDDSNSRAMREFTRATKNAAKALVSFGSKLDAGAETGFSEMRLATETGLSTGAVRGMREIFERGGLAPAGIDQTIINAGQTVRNLNRKTTVAKTYGDMITNIKASDLAGVAAVALPGIGRLMDMNPQEMISWAVAQGEGMSVEERSYFYTEVMNMPALAMNRTVSGEDVAGAFVAMPEAGLLAQKQGDLDVTQKARVFGEASASINRRAGQVQGAAKVVSENLTIHDIIGTTAQGAMVLWNKLVNGDREPHNLSKVTGDDASGFPGIFGTSPDSSLNGYDMFGDNPVPDNSLGDLFMPSKKSGSTQINNVDVKVDVSRDLVKTRAIVNDDEVLDEQMNLGTGNY